jgi:hypothetical protein
MSDDHDAPRIDWQTAEVSDGELHVEVAGAMPKGWAKRVSEVLARLTPESETRWGAVKVAKRQITVRDLGEGSEADLRHELESALLQANADLGAIETGQAATEATPAEQRDERMSEAFRAFAESS